MSLGDRLRGDRAVAARGHLSLDREKAREKLRKFRLPDPHYYVLQFVRAASALGASSIRFEISATQMACWFDRKFPPQILNDIWGVAFEQRSDDVARAAHYLALGLGSAQALDPEFIEVESGELSLLLKDDEDTVKLRERPMSNTTIHVREKLRFGHLVEFLSTVAGELAEARVLRDRCAFSPLGVYVNDSPVNVNIRTLGSFADSFEGHHEVGVLALAPPMHGPPPIHLSNSCILLKDGVAISRQMIGDHGRSAIGAMQSARFRTDLSGLAPIEHDGWLEPLHEVFVPYYHRAIAAWVRSGEASMEDMLESAASLATYANERGGELQPDTKSLLDLLFASPLFEDATKPAGTPPISIDDATWSSSLHYSRQRFDDVDSGGPVLLVEPSEASGLLGLHARMLRDLLIFALRDGPLRDVADRTGELERMRHARRNEALWRTRPLRAVPNHRFRRTARVHGVVGEVFLPLDTPHGDLLDDELGASIFVQSRLLRRVPGPLRLGIGIDGELEINASFDDVERDHRFDEVAMRLCAQTLELYRDLAQTLLDEGVAESTRPRLLDDFLLRLCRGTWCRDFLNLLFDYHATELEEHESLAPLRWFADPVPVSELIERLGPIAEVPSYELADGTWSTLADIAMRDEIWLLRRAGDWARFLDRLRQDLGDELLARIAVVDETQQAIIRGVRIDAPDARLAVEAERARHAFFARPPFTFSTAEPIAKERTVRSDRASVRVLLVPSGPSRSCDVHFVWQTRLLATRILAVPAGSFQVVVRCDEVRPTVDFADVGDEAPYSALMETVRQTASKLLDEWWNERRAARDLGTMAEAALFVTIALELARKHGDRPVLPALRGIGGRESLEFYSRDELRQAAARSGFVLACTRRFDVDVDVLPAPDAPVVRLSHRHDPEQLSGLFDDVVRVVDATPELTVGLEAHAKFLRRARHAGLVQQTGVRWSGRVDGIDCETILLSDVESGGRNSNVVTVLHLDRSLETIDVQTPMGNFRTVMSGDPISPDPSYTFVAGGREKVLFAAHRCAASAIREACRLATSTPGGPGVERMRDLQRFLAICREHDPPPPFDLTEILGATLTAVTGARPDPAPPSSDGNRVELLEEVVRLLIDGRGGRRDIFDDHLASSFRWSSLPDQMVCRVTDGGVEVDPTHPLVDAVRSAADEGALAFLTSVVYSRINAYYQQITDHDELELQSRLIRRDT